jgi:hypothetical protein
MATRSHIGKQLEDGSIKYIYCHWNGYPDHNGRILKEHYTDEAKIDALLELGSLSILGEEIGEQQDFDNRNTHNSKWCLAYGRDRGENDIEVKTTESISDMIWQSYHYVWINGEWYCYDSSGQEIKF